MSPEQFQKLYTYFNESPTALARALDIPRTTVIHWRDLANAGREILLQGANKATVRQALEELENPVKAPVIQFVAEPEIRDFRDLLRQGARIAKERDDWEMSQRFGSVDLTQHGDDPVGVMMLSDVHIGSPQCDYYTLLQHIALLVDTPNLYAVGHGDLFEWGMQQRHMDATLSQVFPPQMQARAIRGMFEALGKKLLAVCKGNHDNYDVRFAGVDLTEFLLAPVRERGLYMKDGGTLTLNMAGGVEYSWRIMHGDGMPGNSMYSSTAAMQRHARMQVGWHDIQSSGHTHEAEVVMMEQPVGGQPTKRSIVVMRAGTYKVLYGEMYPERLGFGKPSGVLMPMVVLFPKEKRVIPFLRVEDGVHFLQALSKNGKKRAA